jgi:hypothetical protein
MLILLFSCNCFLGTYTDDDVVTIEVLECLEQTEATDSVSNIIGNWFVPPPPLLLFLEVSILIIDERLIAPLYTNRRAAALLHKGLLCISTPCSYL